MCSSCGGECCLNLSYCLLGVSRRFQNKLRSAYKVRHIIMWSCQFYARVYVQSRMHRYSSNSIWHIILRSLQCGYNLVILEIVQLAKLG